MVLISNLKLSFLYCWWIVWTNSLINARYWSVSFVYLDWSWFIKYFRISGRYDKKSVLEKSDNSQESSGEQFSTRLSKFQRRSFAEYIDLHSVFNILLISCVSKITAAKWGETANTTNVSALFSTLSLLIILTWLARNRRKTQNKRTVDVFLQSILGLTCKERMSLKRERLIICNFRDAQFKRGTCKTR